MKSVYLSTRSYTLLLILAVSMTAVSPSTGREKNDLSQRLSKIILQRNDIFARHGYIFKSSELNRHYRKQKWYHADKKFSWNRLTAQDRKIFDRLQKEEKKLVAALKADVQKRITEKRIRYFKTASGIHPFSPKLLADIKAFMKEKEIFEDHYVMPEARSFKLKNEILKTEFAKLQDRAKKTGKSFDWYEAVYDRKGKLRKMYKCWFSEMIGKGLYGTWYFDQTGRVILIKKAVPQTTLGSEWHFQYVNNMLVWMTFEIKSYAGNDYRVVKKFFP